MDQRRIEEEMNKFNKEQRKRDEEMMNHMKAQWRSGGSPPKVSMDISFESYKSGDPEVGRIQKKTEKSNAKTLSTFHNTTPRRLVQKPGFSTCIYMQQNRISRTRPGCWFPLSIISPYRRETILRTPLPWLVKSDRTEHRPLPRRVKSSSAATPRFSTSPTAV